MFSVHTKTKSRRFQIPPGLKSVLEKLRFCDGLVWTESVTIEIKLRFSRADGAAQEAESIAYTITFKPARLFTSAILFYSNFFFCFSFVIIVELVIRRINCWFLKTLEVSLNGDK